MKFAGDYLTSTNVICTFECIRIQEHELYRNVHVLFTLLGPVVQN